MIVVDTNVLSELMRPAPAPQVQAWAGRQVGADLYTTAITVAEIRYGIERLPVGHRRGELTAAAVEIFGRFANRVLPFDLAAAEQYALIVTRRDQLGMPIDALDAQIAAICRPRQARLATRNVGDFRETGIDVINPWQATD
jgi:toxin FitB